MPSPPTATSARQSLTAALKQRAAELGFVLSGVAPAAEPQRLGELLRWLQSGYAGQMDYIPKRLHAYQHPRHVLDGCRSVLMLALPYHTAEHRQRSAEKLSEDSRQPAKIARYAQGPSDYHDVIHARLKELRSWLTQTCPQAAVRGVVDTAPLLEREFAEAAGLGWVGKNTLLLNRHWGSYFFLAALLTDVELAYDEATDKGHCGTCTACLDACPTSAFPQPYVLDATKCVSYLTIEHRNEIDGSLREQLAGWVFGCDICQEVCPWNRKSWLSREPAFAPREDLAELDVLSVLKLNDEQFRERFRRTPLWRAKRRGLLRNALLVVGNARLEAARDAIELLLDDAEPLIRQAARWAQQRLNETTSLERGTTPAPLGALALAQDGDDNQDQHPTPEQC